MGAIFITEMLDSNMHMPKRTSESNKTSSESCMPSPSRHTLHQHLNVRSNFAPLNDRKSHCSRILQRIALVTFLAILSSYSVGAARNSLTHSKYLFTNFNCI